MSARAMAGGPGSSHPVSGRSVFISPAVTAAAAAAALRHRCFVIEAAPSRGSNAFGRSAMTRLVQTGDASLVCK